ncbi:hypothetical protein OUZ56_028009 [Daphnia magna]|uniref:Uncharacterized protein n=1 Tax=Daphnia magna TaxID=35525 RepID=A0ABR0B2L7_9CRUS|nr:hypothetical protein OUZ56_028009 [Daphnia magna]
MGHMPSRLPRAPSEGREGAPQQQQQQVRFNWKVGKWWSSRDTACETRRFGALPEIFIGDTAMGAPVEEMTEEAPKLVVQNGCWVHPDQESGRNSTTRFEWVWRRCTGGTIPSIAERTKIRVSTGKVLVSGSRTIGQMAITHLSDHKQWIEEGTVLGIIEPVTENQGGDTPVAVATEEAERKRAESTNLTAGLEKD